MLYSKYALPSDYLFYERGQLSMIVMIVLGLFTFVFVLVTIFHRLGIQGAGDWDEVVNRIAKLNKKWKAALAVAWVVIFYLCMSRVTIVTENQVIFRDWLHPTGVSYDYQEIEKVETGFGRSSWSLLEYQRKGSFYYIVTVDGHKGIFHTPSVNENIERYDDTYLELEEFDQRLMEYHIPKTSDREYYYCCDFDERYVQRFLKIVDNQ